MNKNLNRFILVIFAAIFAAACQAAGAAAGDIIVSDGWGRPSPMAAENGVFYMNIENQTNRVDALVAIQTDACDTVELHEGYMKENGAMGMRPVEGGQISLPTSEIINLKPGGLHVMCIGKTIPFERGAEVLLTLQFEHAAGMTITVPIQEK